jgi:phosphatidylglycerophosphatase A
MKKFHILISSYFYLGFFPKAPGTIGSLGAIPLIYLAHQLGFYFYVFLYILLLFLGVWSSYKTSLEFQDKDPEQVVIDEVLGMYTIYFFVKPTPINLLLGFIIFRIFDILKPYPIRKIEELPKGFGIVFDDIIAGLYTTIVLLPLQIFLK